MLNLQLRDEFRGSQTPGTVISLRSSDRTGAAEQDADKILSITYPTEDVLKALRALDQSREKRPIVLMGERGRGKSHIMAVIHHAIESPHKVEHWLRGWGNQLGLPSFENISLQRGFTAITEPVHNNEYDFLWDLIFDRHPKGQLFKGKFLQMGRHIPPRSLLEEMFESQPVALVLDEFQKWFDGLHNEPGLTGRKWRDSASSFIQVLSEIACDRPDIFILVVSVINNTTDAFQQIHRNSPVLIDFRGPSAKQDRKLLLLHRLFTNRQNIPLTDIESLVGTYAKERFRLRFSHLSEVEKDRLNSDVIEAWPFSPELLELLEDQILMSEAAQETRDLIRILAQVFKAHENSVPVITPAAFYVDMDTFGVQSLLDSISTQGEQEKLRQVARRNLEAVESTGAQISHARELLSSLWMRSMSAYTNLRGGSRQDLHLDITRNTAIDDNSFQGELVQLIENSINIHGEERPDGRLYFSLAENPRSKVRSTAKNDKLWNPNATINVLGQAIYPGEDIKHIRNMIKHILVPETSQTAARVIVLGPQWRDNPWSEIKEEDQPQRWDRPVLLVIPSPVTVGANKMVPELGEWLASHVIERRNSVRFLLSSNNTTELYTDPSILLSARCSYLTTVAWKDDSKYRSLREEFDKPLRDSLKSRFDRFAILRQWNFQEPSQCVFEVERHGKSGVEIPASVEDKIKNDLFDPDEFLRFIEAHAAKSQTVGNVIDDLSEPPSKPTVNAIPYLGDQVIYEEILKVAAKQKIMLNIGGSWIGRLSQHLDEQEALRYIKQRAYSPGQALRQIQLSLPGYVGGSTVTVSKQPTPTVYPPINKSPTPNTISSEAGGVFSVKSDTTDVVKESNTHYTPRTPTSGVPSFNPTSVPRTHKTTEPAIGINLSGQFEKWGIASSAELTSAKIEFTNLTAQQLKQILERLPTAFKASLEVSRLEDEQ